MAGCNSIVRDVVSRLYTAASSIGVLGPVLLATVLTACQAEGPNPEVGAALVLTPCGEGESTTRLDANAECGRLGVPENPQAPDGRRIELNIVRLPAVAASPRPDPVFVFSGGPGQAATDLAKTVPPLFRRLNEQRDVVLVDQRGTGQSGPLNCDAEQTPDLTLTPAQSFAAQREALKACLAGYEADLRYYTTPFAVDDIDRVRRALGYEQINLWGISYGTRAALVYMRRHGPRVRTATLDGLAPAAISLPYHVSTDGDAALRRLFEHCAARQACRERFGDLAAKTRRLIAELNANPRQITVEHPISQTSVAVNLTGTLVASTLRFGLYVREWAPLLPLLIDQAAVGDFQPLLTLLLQSEQLVEDISLGLQQTILCAEDVRPNLDRPLPEPAARDGILQLELVSQVREICEFWPQGILPDDYFDPVQSQVPVLLLSGALDPVTPPRWADRVAEHLPHSRHIVVPGSHHGTSLAGCVSRVVERFIVAGSVADLDAACVDNIKPKAPFVSPAGPAMTGGADAGERAGD